MKVTFLVIGAVFRCLAWLVLQLFCLINGGMSQRKLLVLGAGEALKPGIQYNELFDYSQTACAVELRGIGGNNSGGAGFWLGKHISFNKSSALVGSSILLPYSLLCQHTLIVGPPGAGKTELVLRSAPSLMKQGHLIWIDAAGFLSNRLAPIAHAAGSTLVSWDLNSSQHRVAWNFLEELEKFGAEKEFRAIARSIYGKVSKSDPNAVFWERQIIWLTAILAITVEARRQRLIMFNPSDLPSIVVDRHGIESILANINSKVRKQWEPDLVSYFALSDDVFANEIGFLQNRLSPFKDPRVKAICDGPSGILLLPALNQKTHHTLVIGQSMTDGEFGIALASIMTNYVMNIMYRRLLNPSHDWTPTYIICDEAPRLKTVDYEESTAILRNAKAGIFLMCQSIEQFSEEMLPALNNCRTQIFLQGVSFKTAEYLSKQLGEYSRRIVSVSKGSGSQGGLLANPLLDQRNNNRSSNVGTDRVPVLGIREITGRPYHYLPSNRSAIVRINASNSPTTKVFLTDYSN